MTQYVTSNILQCANTHKEYFSWNGGKENTIPSVPAAMRYNEKTRQGGNKILGVLPIFHVYRVICEMLLPPWMGITSVISPCFEKLDFCDAIEQHNITMVYIVPPIALGLLRNEHILKQKFGAGWGARFRICCCAAAPLGKE